MIDHGAGIRQSGENGPGSLKTLRSASFVQVISPPKDSIQSRLLAPRNSAKFFVHERFQFMDDKVGVGIAFVAEPPWRVKAGIVRAPCRLHVQYRMWWTAHALRQQVADLRAWCLCGPQDLPKGAFGACSKWFAHRGKNGVLSAPGCRGSRRGQKIPCGGGGSSSGRG